MVLKAYYPLNGSVKDVRNGNNGTNNGATAASGILGTQSMDFEASNSEYVRVTNSNNTTPAALRVNEQLHTVLAWIKIEGSLGNTLSDRITVYQYKEDWGYGLWIHGDTIRVHQQSDGSTGGIFQDYSWIQDNQWHQVGQIYDGGNIKGILDGEVIENTNTSFSQDKADNGFYIGSQSTSGHHFDGQICDVRIYDHALTKQEVQYLYSVGSRGLHVSDKRNL